MFQYNALFLLFWLACLPLFAQQKEVIILQHPNDLLLVGKQLYYYEDATNQANIEEVQKTATKAKFQRFTKDVFARPASNSSFWFRIDVQNHSSEDAWLEIGSIMAWYIDFYAPDNEGKFKNAIQTYNMFYM